MSKFTLTRLEIEGLLLIVPTRFGDERGYFAETYRADAFRAFGITAEFVQENQSFSARPGTCGVVISRLRRPRRRSSCGRSGVRCSTSRWICAAARRRSAGGAARGSRLRVASRSSSRGVRARLLHAGARHRSRLQDRCLLQAGMRGRRGLGRFPDRHSMAGCARRAILSERDRKLPRLSDLDSPFTL
jgi:hypothetical protein